MTQTVQMIPVRMLRSYMSYRPGQVVHVTGGLARTLELQRYAVRHQEQPQLRFATAPEPEVERAESPVAKQRRPKRA
jgi:hypothetical protein